MRLQENSDETVRAPRSATPDGFVAPIMLLEVGAEYLWQPERLVPFGHWVGHIPFAFWLIKVLKPRSFVELGTHRGNSYCAMCQAVATLGLDSTGYAVDTWQGDRHMPFETDLLKDLQAHQDPRYGQFSTLVPATFDEARRRFPDHSVDLLHIDGTHTYDAVRHDFEDWLPILSNRGVVIFHDTNEHQDDFGVWRLWEEVSGRHPSFQFLHSHGLGVLGVGERVPDQLRSLFGATSRPEMADQIHTLFATRGDALIDQLRLALADVQRAEADQQKAALRARLAAEQAAAEARKAAAEQREAALYVRFAADQAAAKARIDEQDLLLRARIAEVDRLQAIAGREATLRAQTAAQLGTATATMQREIALRTRATEELKAVRAEAVQSERAAEEHRRVSEEHRRVAEIANVRLAVIEHSTMWQALYPLRGLLDHVPRGPRRLARRSLRLAWWTVTLRLPQKLRHMR